MLQCNKRPRALAPAIGLDAVGQAVDVMTFRAFRMRSEFAGQAYAFSTLGNVATGRILDNAIAAAAWPAFSSGRNLCRIQLADPLAPVRPPASRMLAGPGDEILERFGRSIVGPVLVLAR